VSELAARTHAPRRMAPLVLLVAVFALPPLLGWLYFLNPEWLPQARKNHGVLIQPARPVEGLTVRTADGSPFDWKALDGNWAILLPQSGRCDDACLERLVQVRQVRRALGADRQRVERVLIMEAGAPLPSLAGLEGTRLLLVPAEARDGLAGLFAVPGGADPGTTFLVDPAGGLMMAHAPNLPPKQMLEDLQLLLKASQNWARGGQYGHR
jgi:hypothetical protein